MTDIGGPLIAVAGIWTLAALLLCVVVGISSWHHRRKDERSSMRIGTDLWIVLAAALVLAIVGIAWTILRGGVAL